jgi:hypothetical protein
VFLLQIAGINKIRRYGDGINNLFQTSWMAVEQEIETEERGTKGSKFFIFFYFSFYLSLNFSNDSFQSCFLSSQINIFIGWL